MVATRLRAIETHYNNYRFRSRTEARWAVFYDTLGIKYEYEKEGFDLDGVWYLPDFWLPEQQCWIEIKGQEPTAEEVQKADLLSIYTQKPIYVFWGDVWVPGKEKRVSVQSCDFAVFGCCAEAVDAERRRDTLINFVLDEFEKWGMYPADELWDRNDSQFSCKIDLPPHILALFYHIWLEDVSLRTYKGKLYIDAPIGAPSPKVLKSIQQYNQEVSSLLSSKHDGWLWNVDNFCHVVDVWWCECPICHKYGIAEEGHAYRLPCKCLHKLYLSTIDESKIHNTTGPRSHEFHHASPRLLTAYTAARSARFEYGESGK
jgi:hypothetical protein